MNNMQKRVEDKLNKFFSPLFLQVVNESHMHQGHAGDDGSGESHFSIEISSEKLNGLDRLEGQRLVYKVISDEMEVIHAMSIKIKKY